MAEFVTYEQEGFVGVVTINRPKALNALNSQVLNDLEEVFKAVDVNTTRALVLTGAGEKSFVAGADIVEMKDKTVEEAAEYGAMKVDTLDFDPNKTMAQQGGKVVRLTGVTITGEGTQTLAPDDGSVAPIGGCINRTISGGNAGSKCLLRSSTYADFMGIALPKGKVEIYGIATWFKGDWQILARTTSDLTWVK